MRNTLLHALSNRTGPFATELFGRAAEFEPGDLSHDYEALRRKLFLDITTTDYYLKTYLTLLEIHRALWSVFVDFQETFRASDFRPLGVEISGAEFLSSQNGAGLFLDPPMRQLPVPLNYEIVYLDAAHVTLKNQETGIVVMAPYSRGTDTLRVDWPSHFPFAGTLKRRSAWDVGSRIDIRVEPSQFPYDLLVARVQNDTLFLKMLSQIGWVDEFMGSVDDQEKAAIALVTVAAHNPAVINQLR